MPCTMAWVMRSLTGSARQAASSTSAVAPSPLILLGQAQQPLGGIGAAVEQHILDAFAQRRGNVLIDGKLAGIDDAHVHARLDGVEQEHRMHRLAHLLIAAEGEGEIRDAAGDMGMRILAADDLGRLDEGLAIFVMLFQAGGDGEDVGIEDDVFRREADLVDQDVIGALADLDLAFARVGLALSRRTPSPPRRRRSASLRGHVR